MSRPDAKRVIDAVYHPSKQSLSQLRLEFEKTKRSSAELGTLKLIEELKADEKQVEKLKEIVQKELAPALE